MLYGAEALDDAVAAVVVGQQQALRRNDFACAAASEMHDGILEGRMVDIVDVRCRQLAAHLLHGFDVHLLEQREQPHAFVGRSRQADQGHRQCDNGTLECFHVL